MPRTGRSADHNKRVRIQRLLTQPSVYEGVIVPNSGTMAPAVLSHGLLTYTSLCSKIVVTFLCVRQGTMRELSELNVCGKVISIPRPTFLKKWARSQGRRGCSQEGKREGQTLTSECVWTTPSRSLEYKHCSFKYTHDRHVTHVHRRP